MKLHFDSNQEYQIEAIRSITDIFEGQHLHGGDFEFSVERAGSFMSDIGIGNQLNISEEQVLENVRAVQTRNQIPEVVTELQGMNFSVEMETGTGKTYVYLRTIHELHALYGFTKFVVVVPSVAIREGVLKNLQITSEHFQALYNNVSVNFDVYDSKKVSNLRSFASANTIQILVLNIDAFAKDENIINKPNDKLTGRKPIEFIQCTNPIVIVDEPQNMETEIRKKAIENLTSLCTLRYSATHTNFYNLMYSLNPVRAYDLGLVKQIEVDSIYAEHAMNDAFVQVDEIKQSGKSKIVAKITLDVSTPKGVVRKSVTADSTAKNDLYELSGGREMYNGLRINELDISTQTVELSNGQILRVGEAQGGLQDDILRFMMQKTIEEHLKKERIYKAKGIKVLSLFFIDKVKNYRDYDVMGNTIQGKFAQWFEEIFLEESKKSANAGLLPYSVSELHNGYFSQDSKGRLKDTGGETQADNDTYNLIMQDKEKLLDKNTPLRFIFSHSALREGWDNPNVFQICTLNETKSDIKKRQEIGRGLRLCVNQEGQRISDRNINRLTVVANESYDDFAKALQTEIEQDCGVQFTGRIKNKAQKAKVNYRKGFKADPAFLELWERINSKTKYRVEYITSELISRASKAITTMPPTVKPVVRSTKKSVLITNEGVAGNLISDRTYQAEYSQQLPIPDVIAYIQSKTELTRNTIVSILKSSGRLEDIFINPQMFMDNATVAIRGVLSEIMVDGIRYEKIGSMVYEMSLFEDSDFEIYVNEFTYTVNNQHKTIYENIIPLDSGVENQFAKDCESSENVQFYFKLPSWFKIQTPIGTYNPDWALVLSNDTKVYFVAETKSSGQELRGSECKKIKCATEHFKVFDEVIYKKVSTVSELVVHT
ncbi:MAG: DEAD/DEAH box helicase family protein [Candidatus Kapabacteria bacterium]|nr:DEAD/DEAH box helicase family protein [Candidatus Kapabacteria bacterium]